MQGRILSSGRMGEGVRTSTKGGTIQSDDMGGTSMHPCRGDIIERGEGGGGVRTLWEMDGGAPVFIHAGEDIIDHSKQGSIVVFLYTFQQGIR